jgi:hypothetical protein
MGLPHQTNGWESSAIPGKTAQTPHYPKKSRQITLARSSRACGVRTKSVCPFPLGLRVLVERWVRRPNGPTSPDQWMGIVRNPRKNCPRISGYLSITRTSLSGSSSQNFIACVRPRRDCVTTTSPATVGHFIERKNAVHSPRHSSIRIFYNRP